MLHSFGKRKSWEYCFGYMLLRRPPPFKVPLKITFAWKTQTEQAVCKLLSRPPPTITTDHQQMDIVH